MVDRQGAVEDSMTKTGPVREIMVRFKGYREVVRDRLE